MALGRGEDVQRTGRGNHAPQPKQRLAGLSAKVNVAGAGIGGGIVMHREFSTKKEKTPAHAAANARGQHAARCGR